jgi:hypothetical protein
MFSLLPSLSLLSSSHTPSHLLGLLTSSQSSADNKEEHELMDICLKDKKMYMKNKMLPDSDLLLTVAGGNLDEGTAEYRW